MSRRFKKILLGVDLTLLGLFSVAAVASQFVGYSARALVDGRGYVLDTVRGEISFWTAPVIVRIGQMPFRQLFYDSGDSQTVEEIFAKPLNPIDRAWFLFGFAYGRGTDLYFAPPVRPGGFAHTIVIPYWFIILALSIWPVKQVIRRLDVERTRRRLEDGLCPACGYNLRSAGARCPECGARSPFFMGGRDANEDQTKGAGDASTQARRSGERRSGNLVRSP